MENVYSNEIICNNEKCDKFYDCKRSVVNYFGHKKQIKVKYPNKDCFIKYEEDDEYVFDVPVTQEYQAQPDFDPYEEYHYAHPIIGHAQTVGETTNPLWDTFVLGNGQVGHRLTITEPLRAIRIG